MLRRPRSLGVAAQPVAIIAAMFVALNVASFVIFPRWGGDSSMFWDGATALLAGTPRDDRQLAYPGFVALLAALRWLGNAAETLVALQILISGVAIWCSFCLGSWLSGRNVGYLSAVFLACNPEIAKWNVFVLTDSLYISGVVIATTVTHWAAERRGYRYIVALVVICGIATLRPNGLLLLPIAIAYWISRLKVPLLPRLLAIVVVATLSVFSIARLSTVALSGRQPDVELQQGEVVWNYPAIRMVMPPEEIGVAHGWSAFETYARMHPVDTLSLAAARIATELAHTRAFYSPLHNLVIFGLLPFYGFALLGAWFSRKQPLTYLLLAMIAMHLLIVAASYADWDGEA